MWNSSQTMSDPHSSGAPSLRLEPSIAACHLPSHSSIRIQPLRCKRALQFAKVSAAIDIIKSPSPIELLSTSYQIRPLFRRLLGRSAHSLTASPALREEVRNLWLLLALLRKKTANCRVMDSCGQERQTRQAGRLTGWQAGRLAGWQVGRLAVAAIGQLRVGSSVLTGLQAGSCICRTVSRRNVRIDRLTAKPFSLYL